MRRNGEVFTVGGVWGNKYVESTGDSRHLYNFFLSSGKYASPVQCRSLDVVAILDDQYYAAKEDWENERKGKKGVPKLPEKFSVGDCFLMKTCLREYEVLLTTSGELYTLSTGVRFTDGNFINATCSELNEAVPRGWRYLGKFSDVFQRKS